MKPAASPWPELSSMPSRTDGPARTNALTISVDDRFSVVLAGHGDLAAAIDRQDAACGTGIKAPNLYKDA